MDEQTIAKRSRAYHNHPSHPSDCTSYREHYGRRCPCERYTAPKAKVKAK